MEYGWLPGYVESLDIPSCTTARYDCPACGAKNTFSVTDDGYQRMWYCFHADCNVKGYTGVRLTKEYAKKVYNPVKSKEPVETPFEVPDTFVSVSRSVDAELYLRRYGAYDAYLDGSADVRWDFKRGRLAFLVKKGNKIVDAAGRLINGVGPKWYRYGSSRHPFHCGQHGTAIVVEDCVSACSVAHLSKGVALLGTNLLRQHIDFLAGFDRVFIALDKDATDKAIDMVRTLHSHVPTKLMVLHTDLKNMGKDERNDFLRSKLNR
tara:strand:- start:2892 stop:3683 length:792 start_codon:yes stop_codon:yes gene_type:complete